MTRQTLNAPMQATVVQLCVAAGDAVRAGQPLVILEAMKMEHELCAQSDAVVDAVSAKAGDVVEDGDVLLTMSVTSEGRAPAPDKVAAPATAAVRADLKKLVDRLAFTQDANRGTAVAKRHRLGLRTARENIADLVDAGSFSEYGALVIAAQKRRRTLDDLVEATPADGMVTGTATINAGLFPPDRTRCVVMSYDFTVLAGTQGMNNHLKTDRMLGIALAQALPVVLFAEGGGGRPGDTDSTHVTGLHIPTFASYARLSGRVPVVGIVAGRCFAGNAALLGCSDVIIATRDSNIGMGGPAMVEGGGLGVFKPEEIGPSAVQSVNGVIDLLVEDEARAVAVAKRYLGYFQGALGDWTEAEPRTLRDLLPENRVRVYDMRRVMAGIADMGTLLELRPAFGIGIHTALARIEGRAVGIIANNPSHLGGAIDADAADKAARFMQLCNAHGLPIVSLVDTPGFMVGPEVEQTAQVRHVSRMFVVGASLRVPVIALVVRKGYGLGAMAMTGGGFHAAVATAAWPSGEFGGMGLEGAVRLGYRKELEALPEGPDRTALFDTLVAEMYEKGSAINMATSFEIDAVIDPAQTRTWLVHGLASSRVGPRAPGCVDTW